MTAYDSEPIIIDLESGEAANFIFKMPDSHGQSIAMRAIPKLQDFGTEIEDISITGGLGNSTIMKYPVSSSMSMTVKFTIVTAREPEPEPEPEWEDPNWIRW